MSVRVRHLALLLCMIYVQVFAPFLHAHIHGLEILTQPGWHVHLDADRELDHDDHGPTALADHHHLSSHTVSADTGPTLTPAKLIPPPVDLWMLVAAAWQLTVPVAAPVYYPLPPDDPPPRSIVLSPLSPRAPPFA